MITINYAPIIHQMEVGGKKKNYAHMTCWWIDMKLEEAERLKTFSEYKVLALHNLLADPIY